ncbi:glycosyltransferase family 2 protein [Bizionia psychrotolerans]|uniref:glycosyltransferase family 2 protein n=1 Tax=Bizionia psychrotolerans TaxID=1492901 RepID=UPI00069D2EC8|nr:glycosyltransferase [Bizionia psychrotolerans]
MMLSVRVQCYNHGLYIQQALESIIMQQTNFPFEVVIGDDFSTDDSLAIIDAVIAKNTNAQIRFHVLDRPVGGTYWKDRQKLGRLHNFTNIIDNCQGKYIALLDGDDYWTDPLKLQKQVDFLESNIDYVICFHEARVLWEDEKNHNSIRFNSQFLWNKMNVNKFVYSAQDVFNGPFMATASVMYRNTTISFPKWFYEAYSGDITLYGLIIGESKIKYMTEVMASYRKHPDGITRLHKGSEIILNRIMILQYINSYYKGAHKSKIKIAINLYLAGLKSLSKKKNYLFNKALLSRWSY